jgi:hypothetical protein
MWATLDNDEKNLWLSAGEVMGLAGFKLFVADYVLRLQNDLTGVSIPSDLYQTYVGKMTIASPATKLLITQLHPLNYWVSAPVYGKQKMREPVLITESFDLPLELSISYKTNLTSFGDNPRARFYAIVYSLYQGRTIETFLKIDFDLISDWTSDNVSLSSIQGYIKGYALFIELNDVSGTLYFDNVKAVHSGLNWVRDSICRDIDQSFTKAFYQVPKNWVAVDISAGCFFGSVYYNKEI